MIWTVLELEGFTLDGSGTGSNSNFNCAPTVILHMDKFLVNVAADHMEEKLRT